MSTLWEAIGLDSLDVSIAVVMALFTASLSIIQYRRAQKQRTSDLYSEFYNADHYRRVVMPVYRLMLRVEALGPVEREEYWRAIVAGWERPLNARALYQAVIDVEEQAKPAMVQHFRTETSNDVHTEHEALTAFLYFWVRAHRMLKTKLADEALFKELFCNSFAYYHGFLNQLRARVDRAFADQSREESDRKPGWIEATLYIESLLEPAS